MKKILVAAAIVGGVLSPSIASAVELIPPANATAIYVDLADLDGDGWRDCIWGPMDDYGQILPFDEYHSYPIVEFRNVPIWIQHPDHFIIFEDGTCLIKGR